jgi:hypothetical protein
MLGRNRRVLYNYDKNPDIKFGIDLPYHLIRDYGMWFLREGSFRMPLKEFIDKYIDAKMA